MGSSVVQVISKTKTTKKGFGHNLQTFDDAARHPGQLQVRSAKPINNIKSTHIYPLHIQPDLTEVTAPLVVPFRRPSLRLRKRAPGQENGPRDAIGQPVLLVTPGRSAAGIIPHFYPTRMSSLVYHSATVFSSPHRHPAIFIPCLGSQQADNHRGAPSTDAWI
ncbi:hypothetical protein SODALDRAFT_359869 [Sodiomyces alkalinus F11]|uniref:Uncharacterized protein n=1 Tax=Sodiomyces alkalinus (strain CBS 110278 / VKM F-3762 / F11) TaxID=1314773 RepID=A0A3N2PW78_SODAK|nr:hypothetical protein SODALDRAFT_359869 [Sodiomyces alkalinus F11]ROT38761.1 hypothetical protein SODALDRAFT_359869 [Sodiomyces alkalinus F11]